MKTGMLLATACVFVITLGIGAVTSGELKTLRGSDPAADLGVGDLAKQELGERFDRAYRQQPPLIPHQIDRYQIDWRANQCLACHDWSVSAKEGAPTLSMTHYQDRDGRQTDTVAATRWFCNQCHVPQANAEDLVENTFKPSSEVK